MADRTLVMASIAIILPSLLFLLFLLAPSILISSTPGVQLSNDKWTYKSGETMTTTVTNTGAETYGFGYGFGFSRSLFGLWIMPLGGPDQNPIVAIMMMLHPGDSLTETVSLQGVSPGVYRIWKSVVLE